jgi:hypothetical protein
MQTNILLLVFACIPLAAQQSASPVALSETKDVVPAFSSSGAITLPAVHLQLDVNYPHGKKERGDLTVVYDSQTGHYLWRYAALRSTADTNSFISDIKSNREAVYVDTNGLADFVFPQALFVKVYTLRADSLDAGEAASVNEIQLGLAGFEGGYHWDYQAIDVRKAITQDFRCVPMHANCQDHLNMIVSVGKQGSNWRLVLRNRWDQEVILDSNFNFVSTQRLSPPQ